MTYKEFSSYVDSAGWTGVTDTDAWFDSYILTYKRYNKNKKMHNLCWDIFRQKIERSRAEYGDQ